MLQIHLYSLMELEFQLLLFAIFFEAEPAVVKLRMRDSYPSVNTRHIIDIYMSMRHITMLVNL